MWHAQPRLCVNLRQLKETDTVEFRHFPGTLDEGELHCCLEWCADFMRMALANDGASMPAMLLYYQERQSAFPSFPPYIHWMEERYRQTCWDGSVPREDIIRNINAFTLADKAARMLHADIDWRD